MSASLPVKTENLFNLTRKAAPESIQIKDICCLMTHSLQFVSILEMLVGLCFTESLELRRFC